MTGKDIVIDGPDGVFGAYFTQPSNSRGPGIVVLQEIFGINSVMRNICDALSARGCFALAPDLFWRLEPGVQLTDQTKEGLDKAFDLMGRFDADASIKDIQASISTLRQSGGANGNVGTLGYCLGGKLAYLASTRTDTDASVGYFGVGLQDLLGESDNIKKPLMLHIAEMDSFTPPEAQQQIITSLKNNPLITLHLYPKMEHAFARPGGAHYDKACAVLADSRSENFFRQYLL